MRASKVSRTLLVRAASAYATARYLVVAGIARAWGPHTEDCL